MVQLPGWFALLHTPAAEAQPSPSAQVPHVPPQPSSPHGLPVQSGTQSEKHAAQLAPRTCEQVPVASSHMSVVQSAPWLPCRSPT